MSYNPRPNASGDTLLSSRDAIRTNFEIIRDDFAINHIGFDEVGEGKHLYIQMPEGSAPSTDGGDGALYTKDTNSRPTLFYRQESNGTEIQMTGPDPVKVASAGYTFLPGGLLMQWGNGSTTSGILNVTFPVAFSTVYQAIPTVGFADRTVATLLLGNSSVRFQINTSETGRVIRWMAIGEI